MDNVSIIEFSSNLGLKEPMAGQEPGVKKMPDWLRKHKFHDLINPQGICKLDSLTYTMNLDKVSRVRNADSIVTYSKEQVKIL